MRILLVNPFCPLSEMPSPPLGLACLAAVFEAAGVEVRILDLVVYPYSLKKLEVLLNDFRPQMVGVTAVSMTFANGAQVVRDIKKIDPQIVTLMGGPHVSFCAEETLKGLPELDIVVCGEGEETLIELIRACENGNAWSQIRGIVFRKEGQICATPKRGLISDLGKLPTPARHLLPLGRYRTLGMPISITTSRGCPYNCIFCVGRKMVGARGRYRPPQKVVDELESLSRLNFVQVNIADDLFTANKRHCTAVCDEILRRGLDIKWTSFARVDRVSEPLLAKMKSAGCAGVSFGIESADPGILKTIKKGITPQQVVAAVEMCRHTGIPAHGSFILGLPSETPQTLKATLEFGQKLKALGLTYGFHLLAPFPGTEVREKHDAYGLRILTDDWSQYHANRAIVETPTVTPQMLDEIVIDWENDYNAYLGDIKARMQSGVASSHERWLLENLERVVLTHDLMMKELIETKGVWPVGVKAPTQRDALQTLTDRIGAVIQKAPAILYNTLAYHLDQGNLGFRVQDRQVQFTWRDYLY